MSSLERDGTAVASLGDVEPAGSRHLGRRSAVTLDDGVAVAGTANGELRAFDAEGRPAWTATDLDGSVVALATLDDLVVAGERSPTGGVAAYRRSDGELVWRYETTAEVGDPVTETRFQLPFVVDAASDGERVYVASRRYERRDGGREESSDSTSGDDGTASGGGDRHFESAVYAFAPDGTVAWRYRTDGSPISLDADGDRLAVGYNRCPGDHQCGLVVLDASSGDVEITWDPGTDGQRRVGGVSLLADGLVVASHGDYCGYRLDDSGAHEWRVPLATPTGVDGETVYAYPNHVHATDAGVLFVTGNTYPEDGRQTDARHPAEHTAVGVAPDGERRWRADVSGFATGIGTDGDAVAVPAAQHFRDRNAAGHGLRVFDVAGGAVGEVDTEGVVTAASLDGSDVAAVEEPVAYHDGDGTLGAYGLRRTER